MTKHLLAQQIQTPAAMILWDVTPEEYGNAFGLTLATARECFRVLSLRDDPPVTRCGVPTIKYPDGKMLRMSRVYFTTALLKAKV